MCHGLLNSWLEGHAQHLDLDAAFGSQRDRDLRELVEVSIGAHNISVRSEFPARLGIHKATLESEVQVSVEGLVADARAVGVDLTLTNTLKQRIHAWRLTAKSLRRERSNDLGNLDILRARILL